MSSRKITYLTALVAIGIIIVGLIATIFHSMLLVPIPVIGVVLTIILLLTNKGNFSHTTENLEKIMFFITFIIIICSFIMLYRPV